MMVRFKDDDGMGSCNAKKNSLYCLEEGHSVSNHMIIATDKHGREIDVYSARVESLPGVPVVFEGEKFKLTNTGACYSAYTEMLTVLGIDGEMVLYSQLSKDTVYTLVTIARHAKRPNEIIVVGKDGTTGKYVLAALDAVSFGQASSAPLDELVEKAKAARQARDEARSTAYQLSKEFDELQAQLREHGLELI